MNVKGVSTDGDTADSKILGLDIPAIPGIPAIPADSKIDASVGTLGRGTPGTRGAPGTRTVPGAPGVSGNSGYSVSSG